MSICKKNDKYQPIVFSNKPLESYDKDVMGIEPHIDFINNAIKNEANIIGIVSDHGTGKSSIADNLANSGKYGKYIKINMWDSIEEYSEKNDKEVVITPKVNGEDSSSVYVLDKSEKVEDESLSVLIKSFIYQLGRSIGEYAGKHVNKLLSDNYNNLSFSADDKVFWRYIIGALIFIALFLSTSFEEWTYALFDLNVNSVLLEVGIILLRSLFLFFAILMIIRGLKKSNFVVSKIKNLDGRKTEINEVFEAYSYIIKELSKESKRPIISIEDLDRVGNLDKVNEFLIEVYRLNSICNNIEKSKNRPIIIVAISRNLLCEYRDFFAKIFDYEIDLHTIHVDDYRDVLKGIFDAEKKNSEELLKLVFGNKTKEKQEDLLDYCSWLYRDENLTIRELKDRLNKTIEKYCDLKNKDYQGVGDISFKKCAAIVFLENKYPILYDILVKEEKKLSDIIDKIYADLRNDSNSEFNDIKEIIKNELKDSSDDDAVKESKIDGFVGCFAEMIDNDLIDNDYRMYFYAYPKGSYIKSKEEKKICNYLELPNKYPYEESDVEKQIDAVLRDNKTFKIKETIERLANNKSINDYCEIILESEFLFNLAVDASLNKTINTILRLLKKQNLESKAVRLLEKLVTYKNYNDEYENVLIDSIYTSCPDLEDEEVANIRRILIKVFGEDIIKFKKMFYSEEYAWPLLTENEITIINNNKISVELVDETNIQKKDIKHIQNLLCNVGEAESIEDKMLEIQNELINTGDIEDIQYDIVSFMKNSKIINQGLFDIVCDLIKDGDMDSDPVADYLDSLEIEKVPSTYYDAIDKLDVFIELSEKLLMKLIERKLYHSALITASGIERLELIDFSDESSQDAINEATIKIYDELPELFGIIREYIVNNYIYLCQSVYKKLFLDGYGIISEEEINSIKDFQMALELIDWGKINDNNYEYLVECFHAEERTGDDCSILLKNIFSKQIPNVDLVRKIYERLDFDIIKFSSLTDEDKESITKDIAYYIPLSNGTQMKAFMLKVKSLVPNLEGRVRTGLGVKEYNRMLNEIGEISSSSREFILEDSPKYGYCDSITNVLLKEGHIEHYIVGKTLYNGALDYPLDGVDDDDLIKLFKEGSPIFVYLRDKEEFVDNIWKNKGYRKLNSITWNSIEPFTKYEQTSDFFDFVTKELNEEIIKNYFDSLNTIKTKDDKEYIVDRFIHDDIIKYIETDEVFNNIHNRLSENDGISKGKKSAFTNKYNEYKKNRGITTIT